MTVTASVSTNTIHVGDMVAYSAEVDHPEDTRVEFPAGGRSAAVVVRDEKTNTTPLVKGWKRTAHAAQITSFELGEHAFATGMVRIVKSDGTATEKWLPETPFTVASSLVDSNAPARAIKGLAAWPRPFPVQMGRLLLGAMAVAALAALIVLALRRRRAMLNQPRPQPPPHDIALAALQILLGRKWIESEDIEPFYIELSNIVRTYIEGRFNLRAPERTTEEFIREATSSHLLSLDHQQFIGAFLEQCDLVKFAKHLPTQDDMRAAFAAAERLVRETIPPPPSPVDTRPSVRT